MKKYFAQLRPMERRLLVGVAVVVLIVLNAVFIWPHFSDWGDLQRRLGDAGWAGYLIEAFIKQPTRPVFLVFAPEPGVGDELLGLLGEAIALLPPAQRWQVTFNTYFTSLPPGATCLWRCCLAGSPAAAAVQHGTWGGGALVLDLTDPKRLPALGASYWVIYPTRGHKPVESTTECPVGVYDRPTDEPPGFIYIPLMVL